MITEKIATEILSHQLDEKDELKKLLSGSGDPVKWAQICKRNLEFITGIVEKYGWPNAELFLDKSSGEVVEYAAWLCVQHGDANNMDLARALGKFSGDEEKISELKESKPNLFSYLDSTIENQKKCLAIMKRDSANPQYQAFVNDRIARNECRPQKFGTQYVPNPLDPKLVEQIEDIETIENRRKEVGLDSYADQLSYRKLVATGEKPADVLLPPAAQNNPSITKYSSERKLPDDLSISMVARVQQRLDSREHKPQILQH